MAWILHERACRSPGLSTARPRARLKETCPVAASVTTKSSPEKLRVFSFNTSSTCHAMGAVRWYVGSFGTR
jgi:hypothetical protein